jgi:hypothetical protein
MPRRPRARRRRRTKKTGGTGDKKPQFLNTAVSATSTTTWATTLGEVPLLNILSGGTKVLEILKIFVSRVSGSNIASFCIGSRSLSGVTTTVYPNNSIAYATDRVWLLTGQWPAAENYREYDLTDENGNGQLYPAQQIAVNLTGGASEVYSFRFLYRIKNASMPEYIGIINQYVASTI